MLMKHTSYNRDKRCKCKYRCEPFSHCEIVCNSTCGNLLLTDQHSSLEVWKEKIDKKATVTISVSNYDINTALICVLVLRHDECPVEFIVPPGNTLSATVDDTKSTIICRAGEGRTEGKFYLEVCFPVFCND
ncbi:hypothetical protein HRF87_05645 [Bacillus sp. CRN 9]|nr:hypothetical protein [Bacillus sp. CRN 9]